MKRSAWVAVGLGLMIVGLLMMTGGVLSLALAPAQYEATARVTMPDPSAWQREVERARSGPVLRSAVTNLHLDQLWATQQKRETPLPIEEAERELSGRMKTRVGRGIALLELSLRAYEPNEAVRLANAIADAYRQAHGADQVKVEIVEAATLPAKPQRAKQPMAIILFLSGVLLMLAGYLLLRPHLQTGPPRVAP